MNLKPLSDHLIIKPFKEEFTKGGIVLPDTADTGKTEQGEIVAVGPGRILDNGTHLEMSVKVGDKVMFKKYAPEEIKIDGKEFFVLVEHDILAVIE